MRLRRSAIPGILCFAATCAPAPGADPEAAFDFLHNQIVLRTTVNGHGPYNFTLDSGTFASTIDLRLAKELRLPLSRVRSEGTGAGSRRVFGQQTICG
jgi:hypothetical protein